MPPRSRPANHSLHSHRPLNRRRRIFARCEGTQSGYRILAQGSGFLHAGLWSRITISGITATNEIIAKATMMVGLRRSKHPSVRLFANLIQSLFHASSPFLPFLPRPSAVCPFRVCRDYCLSRSLSPFIPPLRRRSIL